MEAKNADLSGLRINRAGDAAPPPPSGSPGAHAGRRWLLIGLPTGAVVLVGILVLTSGALSSAVPVRLTPATMVSPIRSEAILIASGYVVAQRKAAEMGVVGGFLPAVRAARLNIVNALRAA